MTKHTFYAIVQVFAAIVFIYCIAHMAYFAWENDSLTNTQILKENWKVAITMLGSAAIIVWIGDIYDVPRA